MPVTHSREEAERDMDVAMCAAGATQGAARLAEKGLYTDARVHSRAFRKMMARKACSAGATADDQVEYCNYQVANRTMERDLSSLASGAAQSRSASMPSRRSDSAARNMFKGKKSRMAQFRSPRKSSTLAAPPGRPE